ncbi:MAG: hypothetical protein KF773_24665 [Deltaproteobacteria bacterium]|nr:hypothetical protein [Deltaproteobacteria bacterium]
MTTASATKPRSVVEKMLAAVENRPTRPPRRRSWLIRQARAKAEAAARQLAEGLCSIEPVIEAVGHLRAAEEAGAGYEETADARRELNRLTTTFSKLCVLPRPKGR